ncbi:glycosyl hydrolase family protein [Catenovulum agarivorans DS-2]|uniref:Glycosyl hydrolase family protein n=1 Tax=Catenovulum agarivorans DS-2 TaxID=1328313 RepID=W7QR73_9ALTE|nr:BNR-4 repeat-containing protein [Catenovulum agarivorans]EWH11497.1 glycosyl hydrolase family protein [Catenovulum agarivorans DS-2]
MKNWIILSLLLTTLGCSQTPKVKHFSAQTLTNKAPTTFMHDGGWCWYQDPRAIIHQDKLIIGGISGQSGDIRVSVFDLKNNKIIGETVLDAAFEVDDHNAPVFYMRPDNRLVATWATHGKEKVHYYRISAPNDFLAWQSIQIHQHPFDKPKSSYWGGVTYMNLYTIEKQQRLYNFFRLGMDLNPYFSYSSNQGETWQGFTHFLQDDVAGKHRPYVKYSQITPNTIGVNFTDAHPRDYGNSLYYASFNGASFYRADGSKIKSLADGPLITKEAELIYQGSSLRKKPTGYGSMPNSAWTIDMETDQNKRPYLGYSVYLKDNDIRYRLAQWTGEKWLDREIAHAGSYLYKKESSYSGLLALDPTNPANIAISTDVNPTTGEHLKGQHEIYLATVAEFDDKNSIKWQPLTKNSRYRNIRPIIVAGHGYKVLMWMKGPFNHFQDYKTNIVGYVIGQPKKRQQ